MPQKTVVSLVVILFSLTSIMGVSLLTGFWLIYKSLDLVKEPTTRKAVLMRVNAPKYVKIICIAIITSYFINTLTQF